MLILPVCRIFTLECHSVRPACHHISVLGGLIFLFFVSRNHQVLYDRDNYSAIWEKFSHHTKVQMGNYLEIHFYLYLYLEKKNKSLWEKLLDSWTKPYTWLEDLFVVCLPDGIDKCAHINLLILKVFCAFFCLPYIQDIIT